MAGDEQRLKDAKIEVRIDTEAAERELEDRGREGEGRSTPGGRPPQPGRKEDEKDQRKRDDDRRRDGDGGRFVTTVAAASRVPGMIVGAVKVLAAAYALRTVSEMLPGMIDKRLSTMAPGGRLGIGAFGQPLYPKNLGDLADFAVRESLEKTRDFYREIILPQIQRMEAILAVFPAALGTGIDFARSQQLMTGVTRPGDVLAAVARAGTMASIDARMQASRRAFSGAALGAATVDLGDWLKDRFYEAVWR